MSEGMPLSHEAFVRKVRAGRIRAEVPARAAEAVLNDARRGPSLWEPAAFFFQRAAAMVIVLGSLILVVGGRVLFGLLLLVCGAWLFISLQRDHRRRVLEEVLHDEALYYDLQQRGDIHIVEVDEGDEGP
jgi:hypothetical protein